jgi:hypothetical protein
MSMSMNLRFGDLFDTMNDIEDMAREFGRNPIVMDAIGIRGGRVKPRPRQGKAPTRTRQAGNADIPKNAECDDYPCTGKASKTVTSSSTGKSSKKEKKSSKTDKESKSSKSSKEEKKEKVHSKKDKDKLTKGESKRRLSPLFDNFGREEVDAEELYTYGVRR